MFKNNYLSIYIPRIKVKTPSDKFNFRQELACIGTVSRIDYVPIGKKPGFNEELNSDFISAFIYFSYITEEGLHIKQTIDNGEPYRYYLKHNTNNHFWLILPIKNPVPNTLMNKAQIVDNCRYLELKVEELSRTVNELTNIINELVIKNHVSNITPYYTHNSPINYRPLSPSNMTNISDISGNGDDLSTHSSMPPLEIVADNYDEVYSIIDTLSYDSK